MSASMDDVAKLAGVSKSTVSLVLNNRPGTSPEMRQRVMAAADAVGYKLPAARVNAATGGSPPAIALVHCVNETPDVDPGLTHLYLSYRNGIQRFTHGRDISVMLMTGYRDGNESSLSFQLLSQEQRIFDGLILMGPGLRRSSRLIARVLAEKIPAVVLGRSWVDLPISSVSQDHREQAEMILNHLIELGHRHIGFVARQMDRSYDWFDLRYATYQDVIKCRFGAVDENLVVVDDNLDGGITRLLREEPHVTALLALNDHIAYQAIRTAVAAGRPVPAALSIAGIDGAIRATEGLPKLTTVTFPHEEVGYLAAELVVKQLENKHLRTAYVTVRSSLEPGASCAPPA